MLIQHRPWKQIVNTKTKRCSPISILRWTLIRYATQLIDQIDDFEIKTKLFQQEMIWLNQYWAQAIPNKEVSLKHWTRIMNMKSLNIRRDYYEYLFDDEQRKVRLELKTRQRQQLQPLQSETMGEPWFKTIYGSFAVKYNPQRCLHFNSLLQAARLNDYFLVDGGFEYAHVRHSYFASLIQRVFRCFTHLHRFHSPSYIIITDLSYNFPIGSHSFPHEQSNYFHVTNDLYIDLFAKDRLIYLTPDSPNEMTHYDHNAIYILGGIYDDQNKEDLTYQKALRQNIRHVKLPLEQYLTFHPTSSRALAFHEVYHILLTLKHTNNDWIKAFHYVPKRKVAYQTDNKQDEHLLLDEEM